MIFITPYSHYYRVGVHISYRVRLRVTPFRSDLFGIRCGSGSPTFPFFAFHVPPSQSFRPVHYMNRHFPVSSL